MRRHWQFQELSDRQVLVTRRIVVLFPLLGVLTTLITGGWYPVSAGVLMSMGNLVMTPSSSRRRVLGQAR